ncbi:MAG: LysM peptidoglycan-binding domain-containing protein [Sedimentisphaerales bacterium]|nr:LysM peptidoglycan-binding domain-containing protein [Sedimentisphaerales bacterium]
MRKDLKIGVLLGVVTVALAALWLATRPTLSAKARLLQADFPVPPQTQNPPAPYSPQTQQESFPEDRRPAEPVADNQPKNIAPDLSAPQHTRTSEPNAGPVVKIHIVEKGQTLSDIAYKYYGSTNKWQKIFEANQSRLKDANTLIPGMRLTIPD